MAFSQMEQEQNLGQGYTHKKFNCGYSHKKLGLRLVQREPPANTENIVQPQAKQQKTAKHPKDIFRPYALDESNTPRKRKISKPTEDELSLKEYTIAAAKTPPTCPSRTNEPSRHQPPENPLHIVTATSCPTSITSCYSPVLSPNSYNVRLQRQRAALYMRYMAQVQSEHFAANLQTAFNYSLTYPHVMAPIFNGC